MIGRICHGIHNILQLKFTSHLISPTKMIISASSKDEITHTMTHAFVNASKIVTKSDTGDIDAYFDDDNDVLYLYDNTANGANGCSKIIFEKFEDVFDIVHTLLEKCDCKNGCPKCIHVSEFCHTNNQDLKKQRCLWNFFKNRLTHFKL